MIAQALPVVFIAAAAARTGKLVRCANIADAPDVLFYQAKPEKNGRETNGELDLTIQENGILYPIGIGMSAMPEAIMACKFGILGGAPDKKHGMGAVFCRIDRKPFLHETGQLCRWTACNSLRYFKVSCCIRFYSASFRKCESQVSRVTASSGIQSVDRLI